MNGHPVALIEVALAEEEARHSAAIAAIRSRATDIGEAQRLVEAMSARGLKARAAVDTQPMGEQAACRITLWLSATKPEFSGLKMWLLGIDVALTRLPRLDIGDMQMHELALHGQTLRLNVALHDDRPASRFRPSTAPEAA